METLGGSPTEPTSVERAASRHVRPSLDKLRHWLWDPDGVGAQDRAARAITQTKVLVAASFGVGLEACLLLERGYPIARTPPKLFLFPCIVVFVVGVLSLCGDVLLLEAAKFWDQLSSELGESQDSDTESREDAANVRTKVQPWVERWHRKQLTVQHWLVYALTAILVFGFVALVWNTGLAIESPYVGFVTAPAVFGPFVTRRGRMVLALVLLAVAMMAAIAWLFPMAPCGHCLKTVTDVRGANAVKIKAELAQWQQHRPNPAVYFLSGIGVLTLAGGISAARRRAEGKLVRKVRQLQDENRALQERIDGLNEILSTRAGSSSRIDVAADSGLVDGHARQSVEKPFSGP